MLYIKQKTTLEKKNPLKNKKRKERSTKIANKWSPMEMRFKNEVNRIRNEMK